MGKECTAAKAYFVFKPVCNCRTEQEFDILTAIIREIIVSEVGEMAKFYLFNPCFDLADGAFELTIYRDEYVKMHPKEFGLKKKQVKDLAGPLPEEFATMALLLVGKISRIGELNKPTSYELINVDKDGDEITVASGDLIWAPDEDDEDEYDEPDGFEEFGDFGEIERYSIDDDNEEEDDEDF